jgi:hypothetical protein
MISIVRALEWPQLIEQKFEYPSEGDPGWTNELNGVTNDGKNWFITQKDKLWKFPLSFPLDQDIDVDEPPAGVLSNGIPSQYNYVLDNGFYFYDHLGDLDFYQGKLYVALEGHSQDLTDAFRTLPNPQPKIAVYDSNSLAFISAADVLGHKSDNVSSCAWCAINPLSGLLYTSDSTPSNNTLRVYRHYISPNGRFNLSFDGYFPLSGAPLQEISGGVFSKNGHLYLVTSRAFFSEDDAQVLNDGIFGFDMINGKEIVHHVVPYEATIDVGPWTFPKQELEGITILDADSMQIPFTEGQIHLIMLDNDEPDSDDIYFKHFRVEDKDKI